MSREDRYRSHHENMNVIIVSRTNRYQFAGDRPYRHGLQKHVHASRTNRYQHHRKINKLLSCQAIHDYCRVN